MFDLPGHKLFYFFGPFLPLQHVLDCNIALIFRFYNTNLQRNQIFRTFIRACTKGACPYSQLFVCCFQCPWTMVLCSNTKMWSIMLRWATRTWSASCTSAGWSKVWVRSKYSTPTPPSSSVSWSLSPSQTSFSLLHTEPRLDKLLAITSSLSTLSNLLSL